MRNPPNSRRKRSGTSGGSAWTGTAPAPDQASASASTNGRRVVFTWCASLEWTRLTAFTWVSIVALQHLLRTVDGRLGAERVGLLPRRVVHEALQVLRQEGARGRGGPQLGGEELPSDVSPLV